MIFCVLVCTVVWDVMLWSLSTYIALKFVRRYYGRLDRRAFLTFVSVDCVLRKTLLLTAAASRVARSADVENSV